MSESGLNRAEAALVRLARGNEMYLTEGRGWTDLSPERRIEVTQHGQRPFAAIVTCSDSRVPPEHIFSAGLGDIFVVRSAGNVVGDFERGAIEFAAQHLGVPLVVVMGHSQCGAVAAALARREEAVAGDSLAAVVREIREGLGDACGADEAVRANIQQSIRRILESAIVTQMVEAGRLMVTGAEYDLRTGLVEFLRDNK